MPQKRMRRVTVHYGSIPLEQLLEPFRLVQSCTGGNCVISEQDFAASVGEVSGTDHAVALDTAELHGLEVGDQKHFFPD